MFSRLTDQYEEASLHLWELLEGRDKAVAGTTCKLFHPRTVLEGGGGGERQREGERERDEGNRRNVSKQPGSLLFYGLASLPGRESSTPGPPE